jgi:hypothetical protein
MSGKLTLPAGVTPQDLMDEVTACTAVLAGAQRNYDVKNYPPPRMLSHLTSTELEAIELMDSIDTHGCSEY